MKSILLTSTALVAFAGAAFADGHSANDGISFTGDATLGHNGNAVLGNDGFYWDANVAVSMSTALDNGLTAAAKFDFDVADMNNGQALASGGYVLSLTSDTASIFYGDTAFAAESAWSGAGDMEADGFSEADGETVLRGEVSLGDVTAMLSYAIEDAESASGVDDVNQLSLGATATFGNVNVAVAYQENTADDMSASKTANPDDLATTSFDESSTYPTINSDFNAGEVFALSASTTVSGAEVTVAYADNSGANKQSTGLKVSYPVGPVTATAYYVMEENAAGTADDNSGIKVAYSAGAAAVTLDLQDDQGTSKTAIDGSYDLGNGLQLFAGMYMEDSIENEFYVAGAYDLGGGASVLVSYADAENDTDDEVGANEYQQGTTVEVSFSF